MGVWSARAVTVQCQGSVGEHRCARSVPLDERRFEAWERGEWIFCPDHQGAKAHAA